MTLAERCGAHDDARAAACAAVLRRVADEDVEAVRVSWADLHGTFRGKTLVGVGGTGRRNGSSQKHHGGGEALEPGDPADPARADRLARLADPAGDARADDSGNAHPASPALAAALQDGIGIVGTVLLKDTADRTAFNVFDPEAQDVPPGMAGAGNLLLLPDPATFTLLPWAPGTAWMRADPWQMDAGPVEADPRRVLMRALRALAAQGLSLRCGLEIEFHIFRIAGETPEAAADVRPAWPAEPPLLRPVHPGYKLLADDCADLAEEPLAIVRRTALALGLPLVSLEIELGPSQVEAVFAPTDALTAADHLMLFRNAVRQALRRAGYHATFMCRPPLPHAVASGWHLHQSLVDAQGRNAMARAHADDAMGAGDARQVLSDAGAHWLAGLLAHARGLAAISAPTVGGPLRFRGSPMAPQSAVWGRDNRGAMLRVIGQAGDSATRIENRLGEPMANPYLTIAAQIHAGLHGLQARLDPGPASATPYAASVGQPLPADLGEALGALAADPVLMQGLGPAMASVFLAVKRQELARHAAAADAADWERREYLARF